MPAFRSFELSDPACTPPGLHFITVKSAALGRRADITLFVPRQAEGPQGLRNLPLVTLLHGVYGSHWAWAFQGRAHLTAQRLIDEGELPPLLLAMPSDGLWGDGSGYVAHTDTTPAWPGAPGPDYERWVLDEVPAAVRQATAACSAASKPFICGLSMGGWGALRLAGKHPQRFAAAAAHSSVTESHELARLLAEPLDRWSQAAADTSVLQALTQASAALPPLRLDCGLDDPYLASNRRLHQGLRAAGVAHVYEEFPGGHGWPYWAEHLADSLRFFAAVLGHRASAAKAGGPMP